MRCRCGNGAGAVARVDVLREVRSNNAGEWQICLQWGRYRYDEGHSEYGYRFVYRRPEDGSIQAARGQARIPSFGQAQELMAKASEAGWGDRDAEKIEKAAARLDAAGCVVDLASGYVGWPNKEAAITGVLTPELTEDERLVREWTH